MAHLELDLNLEPPGLDLNKPPELDQENVEPPELNQMPWIDWSAIGEWDGPAHELDYHMVWDEGTFMFSSLEKSISVWLTLADIHMQIIKENSGMNIMTL